MGARTRKGREIFWTHDLPLPNFSCDAICLRLHKAIIVKTFTVVNICIGFASDVISEEM